MRWRTWLRGWKQPAPLGARGEKAAAQFLRKQGYIIVAHSDRSSLGEIDLVAVDRAKTLVFIEVKTRVSAEQGDAWEAVDAEKQRRLTRLALGYMKRHDLLDHPARFDVIGVTWPEGAKRPQIEHFADAFPCTGHTSMFT